MSGCPAWTGSRPPPRSPPPPRPATGLALRTEHEIVASFTIDHGLEPLEQYPGAGKQWRCRCLTSGDDVMPRYTNIKQGWGGCARCGRMARIRTQQSPETEAIVDFRA